MKKTAGTTLFSKDNEPSTAGALQASAQDACAALSPRASASATNNASVFVAALYSLYSFDDGTLKDILVWETARVCDKFLKITQQSNCTTFEILTIFIVLAKFHLPKSRVYWVEAFLDSLKQFGLFVSFQNFKASELAILTAIEFDIA